MQGQNRFLFQYNFPYSPPDPKWQKAPAKERKLQVQRILLSYVAGGIDALKEREKEGPVPWGDISQKDRTFCRQGPE